MPFRVLLESLRILMIGLCFLCRHYIGLHSNPRFCKGIGLYIKAV